MVSYSFGSSFAMAAMSHLIPCPSNATCTAPVARALVSQDHALAKLSMVNFLPQLELSALHLRLEMNLRGLLELSAGRTSTSWARISSTNSLGTSLINRDGRL